MYTANIVDTGVFRALGKPPTDVYAELEGAVTEAVTTLRLPATMYEALGGDESETAPSGSEYADDAIRDGWVTVAPPLPGTAETGFDAAETPVEQARADAHHVIATTTNHPSTVNVWEDTAIILSILQHQELSSSPHG